jgi:hypothetical protein
MRIRDEIRFLYKEKQQINNTLYKIHLKAAQERGNTRCIILDSVIESTKLELKNIFTSNIVFYSTYSMTVHTEPWTQLAVKGQGCQ